MACTPLQPALNVEKFGSIDLTGERAIEDSAKEIEDVSNVDVIQGNLPKGLILSDQGSKLIVEERAESRYEILGAADADFHKAMSQFKNTYWTYPQKGWRKPLCYIQAPLKLISLGIWNIFPTAWPCLASMPDDEGDRKEVLIHELRRVAKAMGGNMVVLSGGTDLSIGTADRAGAITSSALHGTVGLRGFILRDKTIPLADYR